MKLSKPVLDVIRQRSSWRSYLNKPLEEEKKEQLEAFLAGNTTSPFGSSARFQLDTASPENRDELKGLGTYGFIKGAPGFIVGAVKKNEMALEDYGYLMERIILFATDLDLGTCWMGGTFNKSNFAQKIAAADNELVPAVTPIGCITENRSIRDRLIRLGAGSKNRLPREVLFFHDSFDTPLSETDAGNYAVPLEMVRLGPSASNKQPWRIVKEKDRPVFHLFLQRTKGYDKNSERFQTADLQRLDMGIAMCHLELAARELNLEGKWEKSQPPAIQLPERTHYIATWEGKI